MNGTFPLRHWLHGAFLALLPVVAAAEAPPRAFIQRIEVSDFLLLETGNDLALSPGADLVVAFAAAGTPGAVDRAVALRPRADGRWLLSYAAATAPRTPGGFRREELVLAPEIARNVVACFQYLAAQRSVPPVAGLHAPSADDDGWMLARVEGGRLAGIALNSWLRDDPGEDTTLYRDLCAGLFGAFVAPPEERNEILAQLDRFAAVYVRTHRLAAR